MTDILTLGNLLRLARDTVSNPREGAATVLSFAPGAAGAVADVRAGDRPVAPAREIVGCRGHCPPTARSWVRCRTPLILGLVMAGFLYLTIHAVHRIGGFFGGTGSFEEARFWSSGCSSS
jgi:hypothetical protein